MRNRAKCKLCQSIIESFHSTDYVTCKCDEISVSDGEAMGCGAKNWDNFIRVKDDNTEFVPYAISSNDVKPLDMEQSSAIPHNIPRKKELLDMLKNQLDDYEGLPEIAFSQPITGYQMWSALSLIYAILKQD